MNTGKFVATLLGGITAGIVLGILFAPDKGTETREKIAQKSSDLSHDLKDKYNQYTDKISDKYDSVKQKFADFASEGKEEFNNAQDAE